MQPRMTAIRWLLITVCLAACAASAGGGSAQPAQAFQVIVHPDGALYVGDQVSFEVLPPASLDTTNQRIQVAYEGKNLGEAPFQPFGVGGRIQATLWWTWDTRTLKPGPRSLTFTDLPGGKTWSETVTLHAASQVPAPEPAAHWTSTTTACCMIYYITGSAAARDITALGRMADQQSAAVAAQMHASLTKPIDLIFIPRVLGHGGFSGEGVYVSYLDRNYVDDDMGILLHHEFVHHYDNSLGGEFLPPIFEEGLAVYLTGGHFKPEPLAPRAAALFNLGWYIPLQVLADDFYHQQHEFSYLEAAGLVKYLVDTYGWEAFNRFYRSIPPPGEETISAQIDTSLRASLGISFAEMETGYQNYLMAQTVTDGDLEDLRLTVRFFDTVRRYQQSRDPSAYFLTAWLPDGTAMRQHGIVADFLRHPGGLENHLLESLLIRAQKELFGADYAACGRTLDWTNSLLDVIAP